MTLEDLVLQTSTNAVAVSISRIIYHPNHAARSQAMTISWSRTSHVEEMSFCFSKRSSSRNLKGFIESFLFKQRVIEEKAYKLVGTIPPLRVGKVISGRDGESGVRKSGLFVSHIHIRSDEIQEGSASLRPG